MSVAYRDRHEKFEMSTASLAISMVPVIIIASGLTGMMAAKAYRTVRLANAKARRIEYRRR
ncbi:hypothetical protein WOSG25_012350 [Weissella oryzae SG25]|uniref:Uncharacterized protein n=1 Tax=Weissella oryzae (strain DSM 25784 / JCM 18191 / LMG 30913 / SG25) TaxID=1329250 RepID=A0A069CSA0_WEIOS|nr:hypothetical protein [Weissella oryzae]GAK30138.1 hypothetical protein WOSG25_012350 [Weissella oryzae SG25]